MVIFQINPIRPLTKLVMSLTVPPRFPWMKTVPSYFINLYFIQHLIQLTSSLSSHLDLSFLKTKLTSSSLNNSLIPAFLSPFNLKPYRSFPSQYICFNSI